MLSQQNSPNKAETHMLDRSGINQMYANSMVEQNDVNRKQTMKNNLTQTSTPLSAVYAGDHAIVACIVSCGGHRAAPPLRDELGS